MKKYIFLLAVALGFQLQAQQLAKSFDAEKYAKDLSEKIVTVLDLKSDEVAKAVERETFQYAMSIRKHILLFEKRGLTNGKSLEEVIEMVKPEALNATKFERELKRIVGNEGVKKLKSLNLF